TRPEKAHGLKEECLLQPVRDAGAFGRTTTPGNGRDRDREQQRGDDQVDRHVEVVREDETVDVGTDLQGADDRQDDGQAANWNPAPPARRWREGRGGGVFHGSPEQVPYIWVLTDQSTRLPSGSSLDTHAQQPAHAGISAGAQRTGN